MSMRTKIKEYRAKQNLTQERLAEMVGVRREYRQIRCPCCRAPRRGLRLDHGPLLQWGAPREGDRWEFVGHRRLCGSLHADVKGEGEGVGI